MHRFKITYSLTVGVFGHRIISRDTIEEAMLEFKQQLPLIKILNIEIIKPIKTK